MGIDVSKIFEDIGKLDPQVYDEIDESKFPKAPNFLEWVTGPQFLNTTVLPWQIMVGAKLMAEYCPRCSVPGYIDTLFDQDIGEIKENLIFLEHGNCPSCSTNRFELSKNKEFQNYNEFVGAVGQRSGKSKGTALLATYIMHRFLKLSNPLRAYRQPTGEVLEGVFVSLTQKKAQKTLWQPFKGYINSSPWFKRYHEFLLEEGKRLKLPILKDTTEFLAYGHKAMVWHYVGSEANKLRGETRIWGTVDEIGWMSANENSNMLNADGAYTALSNSLVTMRNKRNITWSERNYDLPPILMANISSPRSAKDKIMRLVKDSIKNDKILALNKPTWEINPEFTYDILRDEYAHMPESEFMRDFGAEPPMEANPYLDDPRVIDKVAQGKKLDISIQNVNGTDGMGDPYKSVKTFINSANKSVPRMLTFDLGHRKNAFASCVFSLSQEGKPQLDFALQVVPIVGNSGVIPVNLVDVFENFTIPLVENFNIQHAFFDRWQSLDQIQRLKNMHVDARVHSPTYKEMDSVRGSLISQGVLLPKLESPMREYISQWKRDSDQFDDAIASLGIQLLTVRDKGHKFDKPASGDDDLFRAFALGVIMFTSNPKVKEIYEKAPTQISSGNAVKALGTLRMRRGNEAGGANNIAIPGVATYRGRRR